MKRPYDIAFLGGLGIAISGYVLLLVAGPVLGGRYESLLQIAACLFAGGMATSMITALIWEIAGRSR